MAGIYLHIPFCKKACTYCDFHFSTSLAGKKPLLKAMHQEIEQETAYLQNEEVKTIYFGGGTPSILDSHEIKTLLDAVYANYSVSSSAEITLEANPDDVHFEKATAWKAAGINRVSLGVQSFFEEDLKWMNRSHNATQSQTAIQTLQSLGMSNISMDLIYGYPLLTETKWLSNLELATRFKVPHLSCYSMTVEAKTALYHHIEKGSSPQMDEDQSAQHFEIMQDYLESAGYDHYEISNFSLPGLHSIHNTNYWKGESYLGIGPSAHSYDGKQRRSNFPNNTAYIKSIANQTHPSVIEVLSKKEQFNEYIMIRLRTSEGFQLSEIGYRFGDEVLTLLKKKLIPFIHSNCLEITSAERICLSKKGKLITDSMLLALFHD